jgi:hypothetical protein
MLARSWPVRLSMAVAIALIAALAYWDAVRESEGALSDFASEQATLARGIAAGISGRVRNLDAAHAGEAEAILRDVRSVESPSKLRLLIVKPNAPGMSRARSNEGSPGSGSIAGARQGSNCRGGPPSPGSRASRDLLDGGASWS